MFKVFNVSDAVYDLEGITRAATREVVRALDNGDVGAVVNTGAGQSHHSIGTQADEEGQAAVLRWAREAWPGVKFLAEEDVVGPDIITDDTLDALFNPDQVVCVVDALDGTASAYRNRWDWSVCAHLLLGSRYLGGCVMAPMVRGEFGVVVDAKCGAWVSREKALAMSFWEGCEVSGRHKLREATVLMGMDLPRRHQFLRFQHTVALAAETSLTCGSCALGAATVVAGRAEAMVQPQQWPWDWVNAHMIHVAGGKVIWFHYREGLLVQLDEPDRPSWSRTNRHDQGGLAFIAGSPPVVDELWKILNNTWLPQDWRWPE